MLVAQKRVALTLIGDVVELAVDVHRHDLVLARLYVLDGALEDGDLAASLSAHDLVRLAQDARDFVRERMRHLDVRDGHLELREQLLLGHVHALGVNAVAIRATVVVVSLAARLHLRVVRDQAAALRARHEALQGSALVERRAVGRPLAERRLQSLPLIGGEDRLVLAAVALVAPREPARIELVLKEVVDLAAAYVAPLATNGRPQALVHDALPDRLERRASEAQHVHSADERAALGSELDGAAAVLHSSVRTDELLVAIAERRSCRVPAVARLRVLRLLRAPRELARVRLRHEGVHLGLEPVAFLAPGKELRSIVGDVKHHLISADEIFEQLIVGEVSRRAIPHPKHEMPNFVLLHSRESGVELHARLRALCALFEHQHIHEVKSVRLGVRDDAFALHAWTVVVALLLRRDAHYAESAG